MNVDALSPVIKALADPTRRGLLERLAGSEELSVSDLTRATPVSQGAVSQHLATLRIAGLVTQRSEGRRVLYRARPEGLRPLFDWMSHYDGFWRDRLGRLDALLKEIDS